VPDTASLEEDGPANLVKYARKRVTTASKAEA
jgi:hypothetical protein